jgi:hypothetical protein
MDTSSVVQIDGNTDAPSDVGYSCSTSGDGPSGAGPSDGAMDPSSVVQIDGNADALSDVAAASCMILASNYDQSVQH